MIPTDSSLQILSVDRQRAIESDLGLPSERVAVPAYQALYRRSALDVSRRTDVARDSWSFPPPVHGSEGIFHGWEPYPCILSTSRVQHNEDSPSVCFISLSGLVPLSNIIIIFLIFTSRLTSIYNLSVMIDPTPLLAALVPLIRPVP